MKSLLLLLLVLIMPINGHAAEPPSILVLGDSLSAAYGIAQDRGWVHLLQRRLGAEGYPHQVFNASISGDTTAGGVARLPQAMAQYRPSILILELGSNDGLRGLDFGATRDNLARIIELAQSANCRVLLLGMRLPPNFGKAFTERFRRIFRDLAETFSLPLVPFFLAGVVEREEWMQADRLHPTAEAQPTLLENVWPQLQPLLQGAMTSK